MLTNYDEEEKLTLSDLAVITEYAQLYEDSYEEIIQCKIPGQTVFPVKPMWTSLDCELSCTF